MEPGHVGKGAGYGGKGSEVSSESMLFENHSSSKV